MYSQLYDLSINTQEIVKPNSRIMITAKRRSGLTSTLIRLMQDFVSMNGRVNILYVSTSLPYTMFPLMKDSFDFKSGLNQFTHRENASTIKMITPYNHYVNARGYSVDMVVHDDMSYKTNSTADLMYLNPCTAFSKHNIVILAGDQHLSHPDDYDKYGLHSTTFSDYDRVSWVHNVTMGMQGDWKNYHLSGSLK